MSFVYNNIKINEENLKVGVYCPAFHCDSLYLEYHKKVFNHFNIKVNYVHEVKLHGEILNEISRKEDVDYLCFVDVDSVPLTSKILETLISRIYNKNAIIGIEQTSNNHRNEADKEMALFHANQRGEKISNHISPRGNHNNLTNDDPCYAGPAFFVISKKIYEVLGEPSYLETYRSDCGEELSYVARDKNAEVKYIKFSHCVEPKWFLKEGVEFGIGSTYEDLVYHNFQARAATHIDLFIEKCKNILNKNE
jgi:hypothetical protein